MSDWTTAAASGNAAMLRAFGETVTFRRTGKPDQAVSVVWNADQGRLEAPIAAEAWGIEAAFAVRPAKGDFILHGDRRYRVAEDPQFETDDHSGGVLLRLRFVEET